MDDGCDVSYEPFVDDLIGLAHTVSDRPYLSTTSRWHSGPSLGSDETKLPHCPLHRLSHRPLHRLLALSVALAVGTGCWHWLLRCPLQWLWHWLLALTVGTDCCTGCRHRLLALVVHRLLAPAVGTGCRLAVGTGCRHWL